MLLAGKVAMISGAASGIGRATAVLFAAHGARVVVLDVNERDGVETVEGIRRTSGDAVFVKTDVSQMDQVKAAVADCLRHYKRLDVVHSNAAAYAIGDAAETTEEDWDKTQAICLKATWMIARCAVPAMLERGGVIVITGSNQAIRGYKRHAAYQAAKGGLLALTRSLAADYAPKIRVNTILPGAIVTGLWSGISESERQKIAQRVALRRNGEPEEVAQVALFLASDMSSYMTGASVVVDGGLTSIIEI